MPGHYESEDEGDGLSLAGKAVADAVLVLDIRRRFRIRLDLAAQVGHINSWIVMLGLVFEAALDLVAGHEVIEGRAVQLAIEGFVLLQAEAAGLVEVIRRVAVLNALAGAGRGPVSR